MKSEPHKIKTIKNLYITTQIERSILLRDAGLNTFNIHSDKVTYDMVSSGSSAKSQEQESGSLVGDEAYAGSRNFEGLVEIVNETFGKKYVCPTHNLQGALKLITVTSVGEHTIVFSNSSLPRLIVEREKGQLILSGSSNESVFPGNISIDELQARLDSGNTVSYIFLDLYADGYRPVSYENLQSVSEFAEKNKLNLVVNVSAIVELALLYRKTHDIFTTSPVGEIIRQITRLAHVIVLDAAQDPRCNTLRRYGGTYHGILQTRYC